LEEYGDIVTGIKSVFVYPKDTNPSLFDSNHELPKSIETTKVINRIKNNINGVTFMPNII
jgi:hypothetical protein